MAVIPDVEIKGPTMPYTSLNGNMFSFLKNGIVGLRLSEEDRITFIKEYKSQLFETYGSVMKEYVTINALLLKNTKKLVPYIQKSYSHVKTLKPKATKRK